MKLIYSKHALDELAFIHDFIAKDNINAASNFINELLADIDRLKELPEIGSASNYEELKLLNIRVLPYKDYLTFYEIKGGFIYIYHIIHGAKDYIKLFR